MGQSNLTLYVKRMIPSLILMALMTYGIYAENVWLQYGSIFLVLLGQIIYQSVKTFRSRYLIENNINEAHRVMNKKLVLKVTKDEIVKAKQKGKRIGGVSPKTSLLLIVPFTIFLITGYVLSIMFHDGLPRWQSYLIAFLVTMPVSTVISIKSGLGSTTRITSPNSYYVSNKGIVFEQMGRFFIMRYPLINLAVNEESNCLEVEGAPTKTTLIPSRLRLFSKDVRMLKKILTPFIKT